MSSSMAERPVLTPMYTLVPDRDPIELVAYYPEFANYYPECELQTKRWFVEHVRPNWVIFDVGANIGYYSILFSRLAPEGRVFAFEPTRTIDLLRQNLRHHRVSNVETVQVALGAASGRMEEDIYRIWGQAPERLKYDFSTLDDMVGRLRIERLDCIKIDVDSFDFDVLRGARGTLERFRPWVAVELSHALEKRHQSVSAALEWLVGRGYRKALVTDYYNFISRGEDGTESSQDVSSMQLTFDERPLFMPSRLIKSVPLADVSPGNFHRYNATEIKFHAGEGILRLVAPGPIWTYAVSWPVPEKIRKSGPVYVEITLRVDGGTVGIGCASADHSQYCGEETIVEASSGVQAASIFVEDPSRAHSLILRNTDATGTTAEVEISAIVVFATKPRTIGTSSLLNPERKHLLLTECESVLSGKDLVTLCPAGDDAVEIVPLAELHRGFGFARAFVSEVKVYHRTLAEFKTEIDEAAIFAYIYEQARPKHHLEFGTWEGFGVTLCARSSNAEIWTINLPCGETDAEGKPIYRCNDFDGAYAANRITTTAEGAMNSGGVIGWRYRAAGYGNRVHQILCDSRDFDSSAFAPGFFDTVLIDGGHTADVVTSDTEKAIPLLRSGGIMLWHHFCPDREAVALNQAPRGVIRAIVDNFKSWRPYFARMFWIQPSWILVGIRADNVTRECLSWLRM